MLHCSLRNICRVIFTWNRPIMSEAAVEYQSVARIPLIASARITSSKNGTGTGDHAKNLIVYSKWNQRDLVRMEQNSFQKSHLLTFHFENGKIDVEQFGVGCDSTNEKCTTYSNDGLLKAVFSKFKPKKSEEEKETIEIYTTLGKVATNDLLASKRHGKLYTDGELGSFHLTPSEDSTHVLYVAEKYHPKSESFFSVLANKFPEDTDLMNKTIGKEFVQRDDWGEQLQTKNQPVLCILDWNDNNVSILQNVPEGISPAQPIWTPDASGIVFIGFDHSPERLGLVYCPIRRSRLYYLGLGESNMALPLTFEDLSVCSPRFNPTGSCLVYLETEVGGPHMRAMKLMKINWSRNPSEPVVVVPVPKGHIRASDFPGLYTKALPKRCWAADGKRIVLHTMWRSTQQIVVVDTDSGTVTVLTHSMASVLPRWEVLDVHEDIIIASASSPNICPRLYAAILPPPGKESSLMWNVTDEGAAVDRNLEKEIGMMEWGTEVIKTAGCISYKGSNLDFEAVWMFPSLKRNPPVILWPHGGPHSLLLAEFSATVTALVRLEFAVIFVNYRGSLGFGEENLNSLLGKIGQQDVEDCFRALDVVLGRRNITDADSDIFIQGGSHGGFLGAHLIGQFPGSFKACALRNPVVNLATMFNSTDIPDWSYVESGLDYPYDSPPVVPPYAELLKRSPIIHVEKVNTPTLILLGEKDRRVPPTQGREFYRALKLRGVPVKLLRYPDCDHPIADIDAESDAFVQMVHWFKEHSTKRD